MIIGNTSGQGRRQGESMMLQHQGADLKGALDRK